MTDTQKALEVFDRLIQRIPQYAGTQEVDDIALVQSALNQQEVDVEGLKLREPDRRAYTKSEDDWEWEQQYRNGWNDCVDHLAATGRIASKDRIDGIISEYACMLMNAGYEEAANYMLDNEPDGAVYQESMHEIASPKDDIGSWSGYGGDHAEALAAFETLGKKANSMDFSYHSVGVGFMDFFNEHKAIIRAALQGYQSASNDEERIELNNAYQAAKEQQ